MYLGLTSDLENLKIYPTAQAPHQSWVVTLHHVKLTKKKEIFWKNIPPGKFDPYAKEKKDLVLFVNAIVSRADNKRIIFITKAPILLN